MEGTIKTLVDARGFGFIAPDDKSSDLFFHSKELKGVTFDELVAEHDKNAPSIRVTFEVAEGPKGLNAVGVSRV